MSEPTTPVVTCKLVPRTETDGTRSRWLVSIMGRIICPLCGEPHVHDVGPNADRLHFRVAHCKAAGGYSLAIDKAEVQRILTAFGVVQGDGPITGRGASRKASSAESVKDAKRMSVADVAKECGVSERTARSRVKAAEEYDKRTECLSCGTELPPRLPGRPGQPRRYCSKSCRNRASRERRR